MALLETVTSWKKGVDAFTQKDYGGSLQSFSEIPDPSARILFNIACVLLKLNRREEALKNLEACLNKDPHLAIGHYHKGVQNLKLKRHREADTDFENAIEKMRGCAYIDYAQLGMVTKLHTYQIQSAKAINLSQRGKTREAIKVFIDASQDTDEDEFKRHAVSCIHELKEGKTLEPEELCPNCLFLPPKNLIANLQKREYIGKAKVISSYEKDNNKNRKNQTDTPRQGHLPPPPSRAPPTLQLRPAKSAEDLRSPALLLPKPPPKSQLRKHSADQDEVKPRPKRPQRPPLPSNLSDRSDKSDKSIYEPLSRSMDDLFDESLYEDAATSSRVSQPKGRRSIDNELTKALATKFGNLNVDKKKDFQNSRTMSGNDVPSDSPPPIPKRIHLKTSSVLNNPLPPVPCDNDSNSRRPPPPTYLPPPPPKLKKTKNLK